MTLKEVDQYLDKLTTVTKEEDQYAVLEKILERCTGDDIKFFWKLMDHDLKINIGAKFVLNALHTKAFDGKIVYLCYSSFFSAFKNTNNLKMIVERVLNHTLNELTEKKEKKQELTTGIQLMLPVKPMLAR
jgi:DNA ligase-3